MSNENILPDSRTKDRKGIVVVKGINYVPIYCINCGKPNGLVPEKLITHVSSLCDDGCAGKYGDLASTYQDTDAIFRQHLGEALGQGRMVSPQELETMLEDPSNIDLKALAKDWNAHVNKENK